MSEASQFASLLFRVAEEKNGQNVVLHLGGVPVFVVQDGETAQHVLRLNAANYDKSMVWFRQALGASRFTENGEAWRFRQSLSQNYLSRFDRQLAHASALRRGQAALSSLGRASKAGSRAMDDATLRSLAAGIMLDVFFAVDLEQTGIDLEDIAAMLRFGSEYSFVPERALLPFPPEVIRAFLKVRARVLQNLQVFRTIAAEDDSLLAHLRLEDERNLHGFRLEHELTMFFAAASETTAATMGWASFLLARNPDVQDALRSSLAGFDPKKPDWGLLERNTALRSFVLEVLRMFPSTPVIARRAKAADKLGDYDLEPGEQVLISLAGVQHDRRRNPDPWRLDISRLPEAENNSGQSLSFSVGPRMCGGSRFAMVELMTLTAVFVKNARFMPTSDEPPQFRFQTQLMHEGGQPVSVVPLM